jgi:hypothetical protein
MGNAAISDLLRRYVDRLVQESLAGNGSALSQCRVLATDCQAAVGHFQALINQRQHAKSVEEERKACEDFDKEVVVLDKHRRRDILASCAFDIAQYQRSCELLLSYKEAYAAYIDA